MSLLSFDYNGQTINQREDGYINLTQMCKANGKKLNDWYRSEGTTLYLQELSQQTGFPVSVLLIVKKGVDSWGHPRVAIRLAQWLSPRFAVWCDSHIFNIMTTGKSELIEKELEASEIEKLKLEIQNLKLEKELNATNSALAQTQELVKQNQNVIKQSLQAVSILEEEKFEREYYLNQIHEITKEHPLFSSLIQFALTIKNEQYMFPLIGYTVKQILEMFTVTSVSSKRFSNLCSDLYFLNKNKKPNEIGTYKYTGDELIYPSLILFKLEDYSWDEIKEKFEINFKLKYPTSNRRAFNEVMKRKERQLKNNEEIKGLLD